MVSVNNVSSEYPFFLKKEKEEKSNEQLNNNNDSLIENTQTKEDSLSEKSNLSLVLKKEIENFTQFDLQNEENKENFLVNKHFLENLSFDYIDYNQNYENNYNTYVSSTLKSILQIKNLNIKPILKGLNRVFINNTQVTKRKVLILDLDETIVHTEIINISEIDLSNYDKYNINTNNGFFFLNKHDKQDNSSVITSFYDDEIKEIVYFKVFFRPNLSEFLKEVKGFSFEIGIFTASLKIYADTIIDLIEKYFNLNNTFSFRLYKESCIKIGQATIKDLRVIVNCSISDIIIVDNSLYSFMNQLSNGILVTSYYNNKNDNELLNLKDYLINFISNCDDVRSINDQVFNLQASLNLIINET